MFCIEFKVDTSSIKIVLISQLFRYLNLVSFGQAFHSIPPTMLYIEFEVDTPSIKSFHNFCSFLKFQDHSEIIRNHIFKPSSPQPGLQ